MFGTQFPGTIKLKMWDKIAPKYHQNTTTEHGDPSDHTRHARPVSKTYGSWAYLICRDRKRDQSAKKGGQSATKVLFHIYRLRNFAN